MNTSDSKSNISQIAFNLSPKIGGPYASVLSMHLSLFSKNSNNQLVFSTNDPNTYTFLKSRDLGNINIFYSNNNLIKLIPLKFASYILKAIRNSDWIHIHGYYSLTTLFTAYFCLIKGRTFSIQLHGSLDKWEQRNHHKLKYILNHSLWYPLRLKCRVVVVTSIQEAEDLESNFFPNAETLVLKYGLPSEEIYQTQKDSLLSTIDLKAFNILSLGRISSKKRLDFTSSIVRNLITKGLPVNLVVAGPVDPKCEVLVDRVKAELGSAVKFLGPVYDPKIKSMLFENTAALVLPSESENFGFVILEAMSAELPVLTSSRVGSVEGICLICQKLRILELDNLTGWEEELVHIYRGRNLKAKECKNRCKPIDYPNLWDDFVNEFLRAITRGRFKRSEN